MKTRTPSRLVNRPIRVPVDDGALCDASASLHAVSSGFTIRSITFFSSFLDRSIPKHSVVEFVNYEVRSRSSLRRFAAFDAKQRALGKFPVGEAPSLTPHLYASTIRIDENLRMIGKRWAYRDLLVTNSKPQSNRMDKTSHGECVQ